MLNRRLEFYIQKWEGYGKVGLLVEVILGNMKVIEIIVKTIIINVNNDC